MSINSKRKGAKGERELANKLKEYGYNCRRTQQFCGNTGQAESYYATKAYEKRMKQYNHKKGCKILIRID